MGGDDVFHFLHRLDHALGCDLILESLRAFLRCAGLILLGSMWYADRELDVRRIGRLGSCLVWPICG